MFYQLRRRPRIFLFLVAMVVMYSCTDEPRPTYRTERRENRRSERPRYQRYSNENTSVNCPVEGSARGRESEWLNRLKNRTAIPGGTDINTNITLAAVLEPGYDKKRWSPNDAAEITGYVTDVKVGGVETCNCEAEDPAHRDTHIELVLDPMNGSSHSKVIVEVTPRIRALMAANGTDWSTDGLRDRILGRWVKVKGWMLFDHEHKTEADNTNPGGPKNWRATCWEIHPVTGIEVVQRQR